MKHFALKILLALAAMTASATAKAEKLFAELADNPHVESVYVGKSMMGMAKGMLSKSDSKDAIAAKKAVKNMDSVEIISCDVPSEVKKVQDAARKIMSKLKLEIMVETKEKDEQVTIYGIPSTTNPSEFSDMIIETIEPGEYTIVHICGSVDINGIIRD